MSNSKYALTIDEIFEQRKNEFKKITNLSQKERRKYLIGKSNGNQKIFENWKQSHRENKYKN